MKTQQHKQMKQKKPLFNARQRKLLRNFTHLIASKNFVSTAYVRHIYNGERLPNTETAQNIIRDAKRILEFSNEFLNEKI